MVVDPLMLATMSANECRSELDRLREEASEIRRRLEWSKPYGYCTGWPSCPICGGIKPGHGADEDGNLPVNSGHKPACPWSRPRS